MQIDLDFSADGILFRPLIDAPNAEVIPSSDAARIDDHTFTTLFPLPSDGSFSDSMLIRTLEDLWLQDKLIETAEGYLLPIREFYGLDPIELHALGLPDRPADVTIELRTYGAARTPDFQIKAITRHPQHGLLLDDVRHGPFFVLQTAVIYVSDEAANLFRILDRGVGPGIDDRLLYIGEVKEAAALCGAQLDQFLQREEVIHAKGIGVEVVVESDSLTLHPVIEGIDFDEPPSFRADEKTKPVYFRANRDKRTRIVLDRESRALADEIRRRGRLTGVDIPRFFSNPEAYLPEGIDLSRFSLRVRGLVPRRYNSQPYVRLLSRSRDWFNVSTEVELNDLSTATDQEIVVVETANSPDRDEAPPSITPEAYAELCRRVVATGETWVEHGGSWIEIDHSTAERFLATWNVIEVDASGEHRIASANERLVLDVISNLDDLEYQELIQLGYGLPTDLPDYPPPSALRAELMPHQHVGYRWLRYLHDNRLGGLLADDMGLGKTVQVIALLAYLKEIDRLRPALLVVPNALMDNWHREIRKFYPEIKHIYHHQGFGRSRNPDHIASAEVVLTTYQTLRRDQLILGQIDWQVVVCDEAQYVKNPTTQSTSAVKGMKASIRIALTGTPVENGLSELWCIVDFAQPGKLGSQREFRETFERPILVAGEASTLRLELAAELQRRLVPNYLRRTKEDVLDELPPRLPDRTIRVPFGERQLQLYASVVEQVRDRCLIPLQALQYLIEISSHPELYQRTGASLRDLVAECPKLATTLQLLEEIAAKGEKAIIFTRYKAMQRILQDIILHEFGIHTPVINGEIQSARRLDLVDRLNKAEGFHALILSPDAAGVGLNITGANHVIHYTRLWNPAKENQATDRVYRIGQRKPVQVYYPVVTGTGFVSVEERLDELLREKQALARDVVWPREALSVERELLDFVSEGMSAR